MKTFTENASRIDSAGAETVHHALDALECSTRANEVLDKTNPLGLEFTRHLSATFWNFDRFLFKPIEGAGSSVCVAIGVLFIITVALKRHPQDLEGPFLIENGVEPVFRALFGLLSIAYRNIGILKVLQDFTGQELHHYAGASSPDIIEALNGLLIAPTGQEQGSPRPLRLDPTNFEDLWWSRQTQKNFTVCACMRHHALLVSSNTLISNRPGQSQVILAKASQRKASIQVHTRSSTRLRTPLRYLMGNQPHRSGPFG
ncbi:MAG: hypothetical protein Q9198_007573 [Flavoplaca austrocitrina]